VSGTFAGVPEGGTVTGGGWNFSVTYVGGTGANDVVLTATEPAPLGGTVIMNQAVVYFPSVPERTPTNLVINTIQPVTALPQTVHTPVLTPVTITLAGFDVSGVPLTFTVETLPVNGVLDGLPPTLSYTPGPDFTGLDRFTFSASNGISQSRPAEVQIFVDPGPADVAPPRIQWTDPVSGTADLPVSATPELVGNTGLAYRPFVTIQFSEAMSPTTLISTTVQLLDSRGRQAPAFVVYDGSTYEAQVLPSQPLLRGETYSLRVMGAKDASGNSLTVPQAVTFRTQGWPYRLILPVIVKNW